MKTLVPARGLPAGQPGFTLIELLVVIAIIGVLSAVVLASLNTARNKGSDAAIKSTLHGVLTQAELYYYGTGALTYGSTAVASASFTAPPTYAAGDTTSLFKGDSKINAALISAISAEGGTAGYSAIGVGGASYAVEIPLKAGGFWCVDSTSVSRAEVAGNTALGGGAAVAACQ
jgi:prepilin-type N-terminal cleavage/methylation domain-containing protein